MYEYILIDMELIKFMLVVYFQMLNKEHEKAEDAKPATVPPVAGS